MRKRVQYTRLAHYKQGIYIEKLYYKSLWERIKKKIELAKRSRGP